MATLYIKHAWENNTGTKYPTKPTLEEWLLETEGEEGAPDYWDLLCVWAAICEAVDAGIASYNPEDDSVTLTEEGKNYMDTFRARATH